LTYWVVVTEEAMLPKPLPEVVLRFTVYVFAVETVAQLMVAEVLVPSRMAVTPVGAGGRAQLMAFETSFEKGLSPEPFTAVTT
jgi:hypothetical protein